MTADVPLPLESRALTHLREGRGWNAIRLAKAMGIKPGTIYGHESGDPRQRPSVKFLERAAAAMGFPPYVVALTLSYLRKLDSARAGQAGPASAADLALDNLVTEMLLEAEKPLRAGFERARRQALAYAERLIAPALWERLQTHGAAERPAVVREVKTFQRWGLAELLSHESVKAAAHRADKAVELAQLAVVVAESLNAEEEPWRSRVLGYCWPHLGNARRVQGNLPLADAAFAKGAVFWKAGAAADPGILDEVCILDLEASLRRDQRLLPASLDLIDRALAADHTGSRKARLLVIRAKTLEETGDHDEAIATLNQALPLADGGRDDRLPLTVRFNLLVNLCEAGKHGVAEPMLAGVRSMIVQRANELDFVRLGWLQSKVDAGLGRVQEAEAGLRQAMADFAYREIAWDTALVSLELAVLYLEQGRTAEVKPIAAELVRDFVAQGVSREAFAAVKLFCDAVHQETISAAVARRCLAEIRKAGR